MVGVKKIKSCKKVTSKVAYGSKNIKVHVWIINEKDDMRELLEMGVDGIITDYPDCLSEVLVEDYD